MIPVKDGFCFLSMVSGNLLGRGEAVEVTAGVDGWWYLNGEPLVQTGRRPSARSSALRGQLARRQASWIRTTAFRDVPHPQGHVSPRPADLRTLRQLIDEFSVPLGAASAERIDVLLNPSAKRRG